MPLFEFVCYHQAGYINAFSCVNIAYVLTTLEMNYVAYELYGICTVLHITDQFKTQSRILLLQLCCRVLIPGR